MFCRKIISAILIVLALAAPAAAVDKDYSDRTVTFTLKEINTCRTLNCIDKAVGKADKSMHRKPDYRPVAVHFAILRKLMRECLRGCSPEKTKEIKEAALRAQAEVAAHRLVEIRVFGGVFQGIAARMP